MSTSRYTTVAIALHWAMAALIVFMIWLGWNMEDHQARFQLHKSIGITILLLTVTRLIWRRMNPPPPPSPDMAPREKRISHFVAMAFYVLMVVMPLGGWLLVSISDFKVPTVLYAAVSWPNLPFTSGLDSEALYTVIETMHSKGAWVIIALLALHVAGALKHEFSSEEGVLKRMLPGLFGKSAPPRAPARGFFAAFGSAALLFALIAGSPLVANAFQKSQPGPIAALPPDAHTNWEVDYDVSTITFSGVHENKPFSGTFGDWSADVAFFPDDLESSQVHVTLNMASARTGTKLFDDSLKAPEWFGVKANPEATVTLNNFRENTLMNAAEGTPYIADATLHLKGLEVTVPLAFVLTFYGDAATLEGHTTFTRQSLDLGQDSDPDGEWVAEEVTVQITGKATRTR